MTAIFYPDHEATSANGRFTLEVRSPLNGTIRHRDGRAPPRRSTPFATAATSRSSAIGFWSCTTGDTPRGLYGSGWQQPNGDSPRELLVSDSGWSVIPDLRSWPRGDCGVALRHRRHQSHPLTRADEAPPEPIGIPGASVWALTRLSWTTAGSYWAGNSWRYFLTHDGEPYFALANLLGPATGNRLHARDRFHGRTATASQIERLLGRSGEDGGDEVPAAAVSKGRRYSLLLSEPAKEVDRDFSAGATLASARRRPSRWVHLLRECVPFLREVEAVDYHSYSTSSTAVRRRSLEVNTSDRWSTTR